MGCAGSRAGDAHAGVFTWHRYAHLLEAVVAHYLCTLPRRRCQLFVRRRRPLDSVATMHRPVEVAACNSDPSGPNRMRDSGPRTTGQVACLATRTTTGRRLDYEALLIMRGEVDGADDGERGVRGRRVDCSGGRAGGA